MGTLMSPGNDAPRTIPPRLLIGRSAACGLQLDDRFVSSEHAAITWTGRHWEVHDLGSRNGTYVDNARVRPGSYVRLTPGARLAFGKKGQQLWTFVEDTPPAVMAVHTDSKVVRDGTQDLLTLPDDENPETSIFADSQNRWWVDTGNENVRPIKSRDIIETSAGSWVIYLPAVPESTTPAQPQVSFDALTFRFAVKEAESRVKITLISAYGEIDLPEREHGCTLLALARARGEDSSLPVEMRGWRNREELERILDTDANALNVAIYRARQQISAAGVLGAARLVEVRPRQRRFGTDRFEIAPWS